LSCHLWLFFLQCDLCGFTNFLHCFNESLFCTNTFFGIFVTWILDLQYRFLCCYTKSHRNSHSPFENAPFQPLQHISYWRMNFIYTSLLHWSLLKNFFPPHTQMMMVIVLMKLLPTTQCYTLILLHVFPNPFVVLLFYKKILLHIFLLQVFAFTHALQFYMLLFFLLTSTIFQVHSPHSCSNTHHKCQTRICCRKTSNVNKLDIQALLPFIHLRQPTMFALNVHFFQAPHSFHDGLSHVCPHGSSYNPSMVRMQFDLLPSSI